MKGDRLKEIRKDHHDTQTDLAEKLNISVFTVQSWEQNKSEPSHDMLIAICKLYRVSSDYLLGLVDDDPIFLEMREEQLLPQDRKYLRLFADFLQENGKKKK